MIVVRYQSFAANAVLTHRFQSVATCSSQAGDGKLLSKVTRVPLRAPFDSIFFTVRRPTGGIDGVYVPGRSGFTSVGFRHRWQRVVRYSRCTNLFGPFEAARRFICSLRQFRQEPRSVFAVSFRPGPFVALIHAHNKAWSQKHDVQRNQASGAKSYE